MTSERPHASRLCEGSSPSVHPGLSLLSERIADRLVPIGVVGLGHVGLPFACAVAEAGFSVVGVDRNSDLVTTVQAGENPIRGHEPGLDDLLKSVVQSGRLLATTSFEALSTAGIVTISVDTPVGPDNRPTYHSLKAAVGSVGQHLGPEALVIVESTVHPGTTAELVIKQLHQDILKLVLLHLLLRLHLIKILQNFNHLMMVEMMNRYLYLLNSPYF